MSKITKKEKTLREGINKWKNFLKEGAFKKTVTEWDEDDTYHFDVDKHGEEEYTAAANFKMGDVVKVMNRGKPKFDEPEELRCRIGTVVGMDGMNLTLKFENGEEATITYFNARRDEHGLWDSKSLYNCPEEQVNEARMGEYGKIDAEDGNPPSKVGRGNEEYMAAYNAVLQARGEEPLDIQKPDQAYLDALRSGKLEEGNAEFKVGDEVIANGRNGTITDLSIPGMATVDLGRQGETTVSLSDIEHRFYKGDFGMELYDLDERSADDDRDLEEPVKYGTGHELEWDPKAQKLYDRKRDIYLSQEEEDAVLAARQAEVDRKHKEFDMRRQNKEFGSAPYHFEEGAENFSAKTEGKNPEMNLQSLAKGKAMSLLQTAKAMAQAPSHEPARGYAAAVSKDAGEIVDLMVELESFQAGTYVGASPTRESNEPFDMDAHMAAYESEPETIEYRKQIKQLVQMVADKKGIPVEQAAEEIASYVVTAGGLREAIGMQNIEKRRKPAAAPAAGGKINATQIAQKFIKDKGYDKHFDLSDVFKVMALTDYLRKAGADTEEKVQAAVIDYIQHDGKSLKEGGDKEARIRDVVKMGSWDNIDGVALSLPQAELLVAAMDNLSPANKEKLMAMPINKMLDIVNKMVDAGVITVNYGRAGLKEYGDHDAQASGGLVHSTHSSDPELDQIADIAADKKDWGLLSISKALEEQGFDANLSDDVLVVDGKYFIGKEEKFDIGPDEEIRRIEGTSLVVGYMG